ncbi:MAG: ABC transporter permease, partial [Alphaproteobacteria bacterium]
NVGFEVLRSDEIFGLFTVRDVTRATARLLEWPLELVEGILIGGFRSLGLPALPWLTVAGLAAVLGWGLGGWRLALLAGGAMAYLAVFGTWKLSMETLSIVLVAAPVSVAIALALGIAAYTFPRFDRVLSPVLNVMQSLPHFSYLIPVAVFIGVSNRAGLVATILFAVPPMARLTVLGLRGVPVEVVEAGRMSGATPRQMLFKVKLPTARDTLLVGLNQVIMLCLAMVVIASFVGAKGLGADLLYRLQNLQIGRALESGIAIVLMAVALDRLSRAFAMRQPAHRGNGPFWRRHPAWALAALVAVATIVLAMLVPPANQWPSDWRLTTAPLWDGLVDWFTIHLFDALAIFRDDLLVHVLIPLRSAFQWLPWTAVLALVMGLGWWIGGPRLAVGVAGFVVFIALTGYWDRAMITVYMVFAALAVCIAVGLPVGILAAHSDRATRVMQLVCDTVQTFPSFIYLIPVIMVFKVGDVAAITAVVIYASIPIIRYTMFGLRSVPAETVEAATISGCSRIQTLWHVRLPLALPEIMLGINQTIMFALFMVMIAGFIGTTDLGQEIFRARADNDAGKGLVLGLCVAFIGLAADQLIGAWSRRRKRMLDLA